MSMSAGLEPQDTLTLAFPSESTRLGPPPRSAVWIAASVIAFLGLVGLYRGVVSNLPQNAAPSQFSILAGLSQPTIDSAAPAVVIPHSDEWSTLSGPRMAQANDKAAAPAAKPAAKPDDNNDDDSTAPGAVDAAGADAQSPATPPAPVAAPPAAASAGDRGPPPVTAAP